MSDDELLGLLVDAREGDRRRAAARIGIIYEADHE